MLQTMMAKQFSESAPELYKAMSIYSEHCLAERGVKGKKFAETSKSDMEMAINKMFADELTKQSKMDVSQFQGSLERYANSTIVKEFANSIRDYMIDMVLPETLLNGVLPYFANFKFEGFGESMSFEIENNALFTVSKAGYRQRNTNMQKLYKTTVTLVPENREVTVGTDLFEILKGREFIAREVMKAVRSIESQMLYDAYDAFHTAMGGLTGNLTVANYSETALIKLCETIGAYNQGRKPIILGTPVALKAVLPSNANYRYLLEDDYVKLGHLQTFNGYDVIPMEQVADYTTEDYSLKLDDTMIYVVSPASEKLVQIGVGGSIVSNTDSTYANANLLQMSTLSKAWDVQVVTNSVAGSVKNLG